MYIDFSNLEKSKARILLVENDPVARISYQALLMDWGYESVLAMGTGKALLADAKNKARDKCCALALIDLRLIDDYDDQDTSGLKFADEIGDTLRPIILSGYENIEVLRTILQKRIDITFIRKADSRDLFRETLDAEAAKVTAGKRKLVFENPEILEDIAKSSLGQNAKEYPDQIADVFARLFPNAKKLRLEKLELRPASSNISTVPRPNSVVLKVYEGDFEPFVVKLARAEKIKIEVANYNTHIHRRLTGYFSARLERSSILWDIGGAAYSYVGEFDVKTFSRYYEEKSIAEIEECLTSFFGRIWGRHYEQARDETNVSLFKLYSKVWDNWYEKRKKDYFAEDFNGLNALSQKLNIPEPIKWFREKIAESPNDMSIVGTTRIAITHGDLHGDNLLVDSQKNIWVIDFERCGEGHILQDFIELEADIFNRLEEHNDNLAAYLQMCFTVLKHKNIQRFDTLECTSADPRIEKALQTISSLRSLAAQYTKIQDAREYLYGLLFNMIFRASMIHKIDPQNDQRSLWLASLICHRLDHWDDSNWPPAEFSLT
ncbi:MAG: phosphotransferase [Anaerolineales bacterium]|nr:phosphotransferase [Anaerolineales bacterium]